MAEQQRLPLVVTTETIAGWRTVHTLGYVQALRGGRGQPHPVEALAERARQMGANAVMGMRWARAPWVQGYDRPEQPEPDLVYGTAVLVEPVAG